MNSSDALHYVTMTVQNTPGCPCDALPHIAGRDGAGEALETLMGALSAAVEFAYEGDRAGAIRQASHVLILAQALGYSLGASDLLDTLDTSDAGTRVLVPDTLAVLDFLGDD